MNTLLLKYALEVEKTGSISKAADNLYMNQPHLSKAIKELEESMGISIFNRTSKGVIATKKGKEILTYAKNILSQIAEMEALYNKNNKDELKFEISVPRASLFSLAFCEFLKSLKTSEKVTIDYRETNGQKAISNVANNESNIGIIRFQTIYEKYFLHELEEKDLKFEPIWEFEPVILLSSKHPLAREDEIDIPKLNDFIEINFGDLSIPSLPASKAKQISTKYKKEILIYDRGSQFEFLSRMPNTFMLNSPMPKESLNSFSLVQKKCNLSKNNHKDLLIYRKGYSLTKEEKLFMESLFNTIHNI